MSERDDLGSVLDQLLTAHCGPDLRRRDEQGEWCRELWDRLAGVGVVALGVPDELGGSGGDLADAAAVLRQAGQHGVPLPLAEHGFLAGWLLTTSGLPLGPGVHTVGHGHHDLTLTGTELHGSATRVPWGRHADRLVALVGSAEGPRVVDVALADVEVRPGSNLAGEARDTVVLDGAQVDPERIAVPGPGVDAGRLRLRGALARALMMAGAMDRVARTTVDYSRVREQFGRPIGSFQAVKQHLVRLSNEAAAAEGAVDSAVVAATLGDGRFETAAAKQVADVAADLVIALAHQVHGAIGMTEEYQLQQFTRRLMSWRHEYGSARWWAAELGVQVLAAGADGLWPLVSGTAVGRDGLDFLRPLPVRG